MKEKMVFHLPLCSLHASAEEADCPSRTALGDDVYLCSLPVGRFCGAQRFSVIEAVENLGRITDVRMMKSTMCP